MKIAYTMNGLVGGLFGKHYNADNGDESTLVIKYISNNFRKYITSSNDVDFFIFSWQTDKEKEFEEYFKPKKMELTPQIYFKYPTHFMDDIDNKRILAHYSRWYGFKRVMKLRKEYEKENNFKYDLVINARFDMCWNSIFNFNELDSNKVHLAETIDRQYGWPNSICKNELIDHIYAMNTENMDKFATMFNHLDEYTSPGQCPQHGRISSHFLTVWHLRNLGLLSTDMIKFSFKDWHDGMNENATYEILRYRNLTAEKILLDLKEE
tara:strand:- start:345 stop:1142 length:798 start_codon:yes stop_codon:yes gene_type:complete